jgi:UDP-N-acetylmuramate dehydrogenase
VTPVAAGPDLSEFRGEVLHDEPLARHTSLRVGGPADLFATPADLGDLRLLLERLVDAEVPWLVIGGGYNLLARDGGFRGVVVSLDRLAGIELLPGNLVRVEAGVTCRQLVQFCRDRALAGLEFLWGIPGTVGGALAVNAGAHGQSIMERVERLVSCEEGMLREWDAVERDYGYRRHRLAEGEVIVAAELVLAPGDPTAIDRIIDGYREHRRGSQQVGLPNAGSFFKNPEGQQAWRLIDAAGFRGHRIGGAQVSELHTNFLVNTGGATAADFLRLADEIRQKVREMTGVVLEEEVRIVGED